MIVKVKLVEVLGVEKSPSWSAWAEMLADRRFEIGAIHSSR
jgi:hypothetical protein